MIEFIDVSKVYEIGGTEVRALDHANMRIDDGEFVSIVGPSGSGKSTLMNIIGCLDLADEGHYLLDGQEISDYTESELAKIRNRKIGFIFQDFNLQHVLNALLRKAVTSLQGLHNSILAVNKLRVGEDLAKLVLCEFSIQARDLGPIFGLELIFLVAQRLTELVVDLGRVDELDQALALRAFVLGDDPHICSDARVVKQVGGHGNDGLDQILFEEPTTDLRFTGGSAAGEQRGSVRNDGSAPELIIQLRNSGLEEQKL